MRSHGHLTLCYIEVRASQKYVPSSSFYYTLEGSLEDLFLNCSRDVSNCYSTPAVGWIGPSFPIGLIVDSVRTSFHVAPPYLHSSVITQSMRFDPYIV